LVVEELSSAPRPPPKLTTLQRGVLQAVTDLIAAHGMALPTTPGFPTSTVHGVREDAVFTECDGRNLSTGSRSVNRRQTYKKALASLQGVGQLVMRQGWVWLP